MPLHPSPDVYPPLIDMFCCWPWLWLCWGFSRCLLSTLLNRWQMIWPEIKEPCEQLEGGQIRWAISQTIHYHDILVSLKFFIWSMCSLSLYIIMLFIFLSKFTWMFICECLGFSYEPWQYAHFTVNVTVYFSVGYFSHMAGNYTTKTIRAFLGCNQHNQIVTTTAYSRFKVMTVASKSFVHFCGLSHYTYFVRKHLIMNQTHTWAHTETHTDKYDRTRWSFFSFLLLQGGAQLPIMLPFNQSRK